MSRAVTGLSISLEATEVIAAATDNDPATSPSVQLAGGISPVSGKLSAALLFLYFSGGRDRTMIWDTHQNARLQC